VGATRGASARTRAHLHTPADFGAIVAGNAFALVKNAAVGVLDSAAKGLGTASKGLKKLNLEGPQSDRGAGAAAAARAAAAQERPPGRLPGALQALAYGWATGLTGIVVDPVLGGARRRRPRRAGAASSAAASASSPSRSRGTFDLLVLSMRGAVATLGPRPRPCGAACRAT